MTTITLYSLQQKLGWSDRRLAKEIGISNASISHFKHGDRSLNEYSWTLVQKFLEKYSLQNGQRVNILLPNFAYNSMRKNKALSLPKILADFLLAKQVEGKSEATLLFYRENLGRFLWWLGQNKIEEDIKSLDVNVIRSFLAYVQISTNRWGIGSKSSEHKASMSTVDAYWRSLQSLFTWIVKENLLKMENNPIKRIPRPKVPQKVVQDIPLPLVGRALDEFNPNTLIGARNRAVIFLLLDTGMRLAECAGIELTDVDIGSGLIKIWGKGAKQRRVPLGNASKDALINYLKLRGNNANPKLWVTVNGEPLSKTGLQSFVRRLRRLGGNVRWTPHTFRNTFAIDFLRAGGDPFTLQILGGWTDLEMPRHYAAALKAEDAFRVHARASPADALINLHKYDSEGTI
jgi:site-specific recombinase XerD